MVDIPFETISGKLKEIQLPHFDVVVGIATGGIVPAMLIAHQYQCPLHILSFNYRDEANNPRHEEPVFISGRVEDLPKDKKILLVDDVSVSGKTLEAVKKVLKGYDVITFVMKGKADYALFTDISECVNWPWKKYTQIK